MKVGTQESDKIVSQSREISDDGHRLRAAGVCVEAEPESSSTERGGPSDGDAVVDVDGQMPPSRPDRHVLVVPEGMDRSTQGVGVVRGGPRSLSSLARRHGDSL